MDHSRPPIWSQVLTPTSNTTDSGWPPRPWNTSLTPPALPDPPDYARQVAELTNELRRLREALHAATCSAESEARKALAVEATCRDLHARLETMEAELQRERSGRPKTFKHIAVKR